MSVRNSADSFLFAAPGDGVVQSNTHATRLLHPQPPNRRTIVPSGHRVGTRSAVEISRWWGQIDKAVSEVGVEGAAGAPVLA